MQESQYIYFNSNPILDPLVANYKTIKDEYMAWLPTHIGPGGLNDKTSPGTKPVLPNDDQYKKENSYAGPTIKSTCLMIRDTLLDPREAVPLGWPDFQKGGPKFLYRKERNLPFIKKWIDEHWDIVGSVQYNTMQGGTTLNHHWGLDYNYLRLHLVLEEAEGCIFDLENERHQWVEGELFGFDDSIVLHGTHHYGTKPRTILLIDILKSAVQPYAKTWPIKPWKERKDREHIEINPW